MSIQAQIEALLAQAAPLRCIPEDDPAHQPLAGIVDEINRLRAMQADGLVDLPTTALAARAAKRTKATQEGADA